VANKRAVGSAQVREQAISRMRSCFVIALDSPRCSRRVDRCLRWARGDLPAPPTFVFWQQGRKDALAPCRTGRQTFQLPVLLTALPEAWPQVAPPFSPLPCLALPAHRTCAVLELRRQTHLSGTSEHSRQKAARSASGMAAIRSSNTPARAGPWEVSGCPSSATSESSRFVAGHIEASINLPLEILDALAAFVAKAELPESRRACDRDGIPAQVRRVCFCLLYVMSWCPLWLTVRSL